jgi:hypothetical protein
MATTMMFNSPAIVGKAAKLGSFSSAAMLG